MAERISKKQLAEVKKQSEKIKDLKTIDGGNSDDFVAKRDIKVAYLSPVILGSSKVRGLEIKKGDKVIANKYSKDFIRKGNLYFQAKDFTKK